MVPRRIVEKMKPKQKINTDIERQRWRWRRGEAREHRTKSSCSCRTSKTAAQLLHSLALISPLSVLVDTLKVPAPLNFSFNLSLLMCRASLLRDDVDCENVGKWTKPATRAKSRSTAAALKSCWIDRVYRWERGARGNEWKYRIVVVVVELANEYLHNFHFFSSVSRAAAWQDQ